MDAQIGEWMRWLGISFVVSCKWMLKNSWWMWRFCIPFVISRKWMLKMGSECDDFACFVTSHKWMLKMGSECDDLPYLYSQFYSFSLRIITRTCWKLSATHMAFISLTSLLEGVGDDREPCQKSTDWAPLEKDHVSLNSKQTNYVLSHLSLTRALTLES